MRAIGTAVALALGTSHALAADLRMAPVAAPPLVTSWSGFYIGAHAGSLWGMTDWQASFTGPFQTQTTGFLGGGQLGANYQLSGLPLVVGVEAEFSAVSAPGTSFTSSTPRSISAVSGRVGVVSSATTLIFVKAGPAWLHTNYVTGSSGFVSPRSTFNPHVSETKLGVLAGIGAEYLITPNWSAKLEYDFMDFGSSTVAFGNPSPPGAFEQTFNVRQRDHVVKVGVNYLFGPR
jgi:outer membrane immunogenic protein